LVAVLIAGFIAGMLVEGLLKGLFVGLVISVIGILIVMFFFGGLPGVTNTNDITGSLLGGIGIATIVISSIAGLAGGYLRRYKIGK
jgi:hypothetical protein